MIQDLYLADSDARGGAEENFRASPECRWDGIHRQPVVERLLDPENHGFERENDHETLASKIERREISCGERAREFLERTLKLEGTVALIMIAAAHVTDIFNEVEDHSELRKMSLVHPAEYARYRTACQKFMPGINLPPTFTMAPTPSQRRVPERFRDRVVYSERV